MRLHRPQPLLAVGLVLAIPTADFSVRADRPRQDFGADKRLVVSERPPARAYLRFRPSDEHYQHGTPRGDPRKLGRQLERRSVDPVDVLHDQDERLRRRERADPIAKCVVQRASKRLGLELRDRIVLDG